MSIAVGAEPVKVSSSTLRRDAAILRELATRYAELAALPIQEERRRLWSAHFGLKPTRPPVVITYGSWNVWCREVFGTQTLQCEEQLFRDIERGLRMRIFHQWIGDDYVLEPWVSVRAVFDTPEGIYGDPWGFSLNRKIVDPEGGSWKHDPPIKTWADMARLVKPPHRVNEAATAARIDRVREAIGDVIEIDVSRGPVLNEFAADISTTLAIFRGLQQMMIDMYESPAELKRLLAFMRDGVLANQQEAEDAGNYSLSFQHNQAITYADELPRPQANAFGRKRSELWGFFAAQEFTLVSPAFHDEFLLQYQLPIMEKYGLVHYGCCENLTRKINMLRQAKNLRSIAVAPVADLAKCVEQIGRDYCVSWRPSPAEHVCTSWDAKRIARKIREGLAVVKDSIVHIHLKDVETVQGDPERLRQWTSIVRQTIEESW